MPRCDLCRSNTERKWVDNTFNPLKLSGLKLAWTPLIWKEHNLAKTFPAYNANPINKKTG